MMESYDYTVFDWTTNLMNTLKLTSSELNLKAVLMNGQTFRWRNIGECYYGVVEGLLLYMKQLDDETIEWSCLGRSDSSSDIDVSKKLHEYFQLDISVENLWDEWCAREPFMAKLRSIKELQGIRILKQDFFETLIAFICSSNNNIPRISKMVNQLAIMYGMPITLHRPTVDYEVVRHFPELGFAFPTLSQMVNENNLCENLRKQSFGYRARSVSETVHQLSSMPTIELSNLRSLPYEHIRKFLLGFTGVGLKVAECVALMSLGQHQSVPVDRHIFEITKKYFMPSLKNSSLTDSLNRRIMDFYKKKFGAYAGWAQAALFNQQLENFICDLFVNEPVSKKSRRSRR
ncbi:8-oxoguanine DNA-glycosylase [Dictyocaulus viviparus]|uniref:DNA-(apurinic or apyrimidinic site) lyase n=1 Tax=Dictyocaulus viviparus TaxID=29172 RepID=A0A0D8XHW1_DICVI|nr:8-oxoguanine DNA-glycosylase [Dictyocaulus viviparus]